MNTNCVAFGTVAALAAATAGFSIAAATTATTVATVAYAILGITAGGASFGAITAWFATDKDSTAADYFRYMKSHAGIGIAAMYEFVAQQLLGAVVEGFRNVITGLIEEKFLGDKRRTA
jgi:hypothetical protein